MKILSAAVRLVGLSLILGLMSLPMSGQDRVGGLQGTVSDETDAVLPGVTVTLTNKLTHWSTTSVAGPYGDYAVHNLEPGSYAVSFELAGFSRTAFPSIDILSGRNLRLDTKLKPGAVTTTVEVTHVPP